MSHQDKEGDLVRRVSKASLLGPAALRMESVPIVNVERVEDEMESPDAQRVGATLKMPSTQAARLTKAYNRLMEMRESGSAEGVVMKQIAAVEMELISLKQKCQNVRPANKEQAEFKEVWMRKYVASKENFMSQLRQEHPPNAGAREEVNVEDEVDEASPCSVYSAQSRLSVTSSVRQALAQAEEDQAKLVLRQKQLAEQQEFRRRQQERQRRERARQEEEEQVLIEQQERHELELQLEGVRARRAALSRAASAVGGSYRGQGNMERIPQPTEDWLQDARRAAEPDPIERPQGGFVAATAPTPRRDMHDQLLQHIILAQAKLPTFKGEPLDFLWFQKAFEAQVASVTDDPERRLYLLLQQLQGAPHDLVKGCQLLHPAEGYERAMKKLKERYGHPVRQAMAFRSKLMSWPSVRTAAELESFNVQLQLCQDVKLSGHGLAELDSPATLLQLASKLTGKLQLAWQTRAFDVECNQSREATFDDFVKFVQRQAGLRTHPVYCKLNGDGRASDMKTARTAATASSEETVAATKSMGGKTPASSERMESVPEPKEQARVPDAFKAPCLLCKGSHSASVCGETSDMAKKDVYEKLQGLCFGCLKPGHLARHCQDRAICKKCEKRHPTILHRDVPSVKGSDGKEKGRKEGKETALATREGDDFAVSTVPVRVWKQLHNPVGVEVHAVLDPASTATFITSELVTLLKLVPAEARIGVTTMTSSQRLPVGVVHGLKLSGLTDEEEFTIPTAYVVEALPFQNVPTEDEVNWWPHLRHVAFEHRPEAPVAMLLGLNVASALRPVEVVQGSKEEPYAVKTPLGWSLQGPLATSDANERATTCWTKVEAEQVNRQLEQLHYRDFDSAFDFQKKGPSQEDRDWQRIVKKSIKREQVEKGMYQYVVDLPFKNGAQTLSDNYDQATQRLRSLLRKFQGKEQFRQDYQNFMSKMITAGYVEEVRSKDADHSVETKVTGPQRLVNYVIHHGVYHPRKPGKIRVVFNCASKYQGVALNDLLLPGPDLTNSLMGVLLRFRGAKVAFMADIESMFYRVQVPETQRDVLRFLWSEGEGDGQTPTIYRLKVHLFGAASSPSIANYALRKAAEDARKENEVGEEVERAVKENFYVDDCLKAMKSEKEAIDMALGLIKACKFGGFRLTKFVSTSRALLKALPAGELAKNLENVDLNDDKADPLGALQERALGVAWQVKQDCFQFQIQEAKKTDTRVTKRDVLSKLSAVYDPLGMAAPVVVVARILFRELTKDGLSWDQDLDDKRHTGRWSAWENELVNLHDVRVPRCLTVEGPQKWQLHVFCDASVEAYAAVAYLRQEQSHEMASAHVSFVVGKARVSPPKVVTVPRLELTAAKLAVELAEVVIRELAEIPVTNRTFWTDSMTVLKYLRNRSKRFHVFVANRVCTILNVSAVSEWRHVPSKSNPADEATRGLAARALKGSMWLHGPTFLTQPEQEWPSDPETPLSEDDPELKKEEKVTATSHSKEVSLVEALVQKYGKPYKVRYLVAIWAKFKAWLQSHKAVKQTQVTVGDLKRADVLIVQWLQRAAWPKEMRQIQDDEQVGKHSPLRKLCPIMSNGLLVMNSRIRSKLPIIPVGEYGERLAQEAHEQQGHQGRQATATALLQQYWPLGLNKLVRKVVRRCPSCQRRHAQPRTTAMAPLPEHRFVPQAQKAFYVTGVDYFGPFHPVRGRGTFKAYGVIFTCTITRAIHLEVAEDLSSSSFINALRRFVSRRGRVHRLVSDNGTNFVGANTILTELRKTELQKQRATTLIHSELRKKGIEWSFNAPGASHHGGFWERLIRSVRRVLEALLERARLTYEVLITVLCECEFILNNRPITTVSDDPRDLEALTPNHLLLGVATDDATSGLPGDFKDTANALQHRWKQVQWLVTEFWRRWHAEYKALLHQRPKWHSKASREIQVNDPVLVIDPVQSREYWKLGRVEKVHYNSVDGLVRVVDVKTKDGTLTRPITKLCLLETASENE